MFVQNESPDIILTLLCQHSVPTSDVTSSPWALPSLVFTHVKVIVTICRGCCQWKRNGEVSVPFAFPGVLTLHLCPSHPPVIWKYEALSE